MFPISAPVGARGKRMLIGIDLANDFRSLRGALVIARGRGRYLQIQHADCEDMELPTGMVEVLAGMGAGGGPSVQALGELRADLADQQASLAESLQSRAGKYVDRILGLSVTDPGYHWLDFDGRSACQGLTDPVRLAELTGLSVIDAFRDRDLAAGGTGDHLEGLPLWLLFADRTWPVARHGVGLSWFRGRDATIWWLPPSDGRDTDPPKIRTRVVRDWQWESWGEAWFGWEDLAPFSEAKIWLAGDCPFDSDWAARTAAIFPDSVCRLTEDQSLPGGSLGAITAAVLGLLHIDQFPANLPNLTGAASQRILGRLTPGTPAAFRRLVDNLTEWGPGALRLRDAV